MNALTKAMERSGAMISTAQATALQMKGFGMMDRMSSPSMGSSPSDWQAQSKNRESYAQFRSWVYAAVNALASEAATQPVNVGKLKGSDAQERSKRGLNSTKSFHLQKMPKNIRNKAAKQELEVLADHDLIDLMEKPNPIQHRYQFVYSFVANLNLTGRAYIVRDEEDGKDVYYSLPSTWVRPDHSKGPFAQFFVANPRDLDFTAKTEPLDASQVIMAYLPNPADPMGCLSPANSMSAAIRVDDRIQTCQEKFFDNGIFPSVIVTIGKDPHPEVPGGIRPRLSNIQRRQVIGAIRRVMGSVANYGNPAIVDGLIENITKFSNTQPEIGWEKSEGTLKTRILSAFCVHPFILGEPVGVGGYAQTYVIQDRFYKRINIFLDLLSTLMTECQATRQKEKAKATKPGLTSSKEKIIVWWEECKATDPSLDWSNWKAARQNNDLSQNELRAKLGLPPDEDRNECFLSTTMMAVVTPLLTALGQGTITQDQCEATLKGMGLPDDLAEAMSEPPEQPVQAPSPFGDQSNGLPPEFGGDQQPTDEEAQGGEEPAESEPGKFPPKPGRMPKKPTDEPSDTMEEASATLRLAIKELRRPMNPEDIATKILQHVSR